MKLEFNYLTSISIGLFISSLILLISRFMGMPITGLIISIILSAFIASFLYNPSKKKNVNHRTLRGIGASVILCLVFGIVFSFYYIPRFGNLIPSYDISFGISVLLVLVFTVVGGIIVGSLGGSIGSTIRDILSIAKRENKE